VLLDETFTHHYFYTFFGHDIEKFLIESRRGKEAYDLSFAALNVHIVLFTIDREFWHEKFFAYRAFYCIV
jgi:hypothetical protein